MGIFTLLTLPREERARREALAARWSVLARVVRGEAFADNHPRRPAREG